MSGMETNLGPTGRVNLQGTEFQQGFEEISKLIAQFETPLLTTSKTKGGGQTGFQGPAPSTPQLEAPVLNIEDMTRALMEIQTKLQDESVQMSKEDIKTNMDQKQALHQQRMDKIKEFMNKMDEAKIGGTVGKVFGWIGVVAGAVASCALIVAGVICCCTGAGAVVGGLLIASGAFALAATGVGALSMISGETGNWLNEGIAEIFKAFGMNEKDALMAAQITVVATIVALSVCSAVCGFAAAGAGLFAGAGSAASATASTASSVANVMKEIATWVSKGSMVVGGLAQMGSGAAQIETAVVTKEAEDARADSKEIEAFMKRLQMMMEDEMKAVSEMLKKMQEGVDVVMQIMSSQHDTHHFLAQQQGV